VPDREQQGLQAECRNGITALSKAIATAAMPPVAREVYSGE